MTAQPRSTNTLLAAVFSGVVTSRRRRSRSVSPPISSFPSAAAHGRPTFDCPAAHGACGRSAAWQRGWATAPTGLWTGHRPSSRLSPSTLLRRCAGSVDTDTGRWSSVSSALPAGRRPTRLTTRCCYWHKTRQRGPRWRAPGAMTSATPCTLSSTVTAARGHTTATTLNAYCYWQPD